MKGIRVVADFVWLVDVPLSHVGTSHYKLPLQPSDRGGYTTYVCHFCGCLILYMGNRVRRELDESAYPYLHLSENPACNFMHSITNGARTS